MGVKDKMTPELPLPRNLLNTSKYVKLQLRAFHTFCFTFPIGQQFGKETCLRNHCQHCTCSFKCCSHHLGELSSSWQCSGRQRTVLPISTSPVSMSNLYTSLPSPLRTLAREPWYVMIYPETVQQTKIFSTKLISEMPLQDFAWLYNNPSLDMQDT